MTPATVDLVRALARILRAAADEADVIAAESQAPRQRGELRSPGAPVSDLVKRRALDACRRAGLDVDK